MTKDLGEIPMGGVPNTGGVGRVGNFDPVFRCRNGTRSGHGYYQKETNRKCMSSIEWYQF